MGVVVAKNKNSTLLCRFLVIAAASFLLFQTVLFCLLATTTTQQEGAVAAALQEGTRKLKVDEASYLDDKTHENKKSSSSSSSLPRNWFDAVVAAQYPHSPTAASFFDDNADSDAAAFAFPKVLYPFEWNQDPILQPVLVDKLYRNSPGILHVQWPPGTAARHFGIRDEPAAAYDGGHTVQGTWPDALAQLTFVPVLKNAHTLLLNAMADLKQRIDATAVDLVQPRGGGPTVDARIRRIMEDAAAKQRQHAAAAAAAATTNNNGTSTMLGEGHVVFAVVRDPIDRFLSATCQELSMKARVRKWCQHVFHNSSTSDDDDRNNAAASLLVDCLLDHLTTQRRLLYHQTPQVSQIAAVTANIAPGLGISLIPQEGQTVQHLVAALGGHNQKLRSRTDNQDYKKQGLTGTFCQLQMHDLTASQLSTLCWIYAADVHFLRHVAGVLTVPLCSDDSVLVTARLCTRHEGNHAHEP